MKKLFMVVVGLLLSASSVVYAAGGKQYGVTNDGTYFVSQELVNQAEGGTLVYARGARTGWKDVKMSLVDGYYVAKTGKKVTGRQIYCFWLGNSFLPEALGDAIPSSDRLDNNQGSFNFATDPVDRVPQK